MLACYSENDALFLITYYLLPQTKRIDRMSAVVYAQTATTRQKASEKAIRALQIARNVGATAGAAPISRTCASHNLFTYESRFGTLRQLLRNRRTRHKVLLKGFCCPVRLHRISQRRAFCHGSAGFKSQKHRRASRKCSQHALGLGRLKCALAIRTLHHE
jgi:hypothetical protein